ncbi:MAG: 50S ribosomal protein L11 methyltransferase [Thermaurantimonas sp.]|uniref:50S ribosomal protein L11 methyltransferase n=1 Tax=Thermaurantimonas sp. TaxID=2681568 RepID=UPI00391B7AA6
MEKQQNYLGYHVSLTEVEPWKDLIICELGEVGFDMFEDTDNGFVAWGYEKNIDQQKAMKLLEEYEKKVSLTLRVEQTPIQNWNQEWEKNFDPVEIPGFLRIQAPFHQWKEGFQYSIVIAPKMAFGTGHHSTTYGMCMLMQKIDFKGKRVLDMGCGSGVLGILALKMGAHSADGIDIDEWAVQNTEENSALNSVNMYVKLGDASTISGVYDVILANIQRNVLLADIPEYIKHLSGEGNLLVSGFYLEDIPAIESVCVAHQLYLIDRFTNNGWVALHFQKKN